MHSRAKEWINRLNLQPHPEGGFYAETYRSSEMIKESALPSRFQTDHALSTAIYYLLEGSDFSSFHRIKSDEMWHHYDGGAVTIYIITADGILTELVLGKDLNNGELPQIVVEAGNWFAVKVNEPSFFCLAGCTVSPGFDFNDFELAKANQLVQTYPQHGALIRSLTRS